MWIQRIYYNVLQAILRGEPYKQISERYGVPIRTIGLWRKQAGIAPRKRGAKGRNRD